MPANIHAVDVVNSSDAAHFIVWKRDGMLAPYVPEDVAKFYPAEHKDPDGMFASFRVWLCVIAYNTNLVKTEDAPKSFADLLDPKWKGKIVKAHPGYSGTIMTATYQMLARPRLGLFREARPAEHHAGAVGGRSAEEARARRARGAWPTATNTTSSRSRRSGEPVEPVYATEGTPLIVGPNGMFKAAPNPNAARLFQSFCFTPECQQLMHRRRRPALGASAGQGKGRPQAVQARSR